jgi:hypothetical protein
MNAIELKTDKDGVTSWLRGGVQQICPFRQPMLIPGNTHPLAMGGQPSVSLMYHTCDNRCPHLYLSENSVIVTCGDTNIQKRIQDTP